MLASEAKCLSTYCFKRYPLSSLLHLYTVNSFKYSLLYLKHRNTLNRVITARCTLVQSAVLRSHVVCLSVCPSVTLVNCDHIGWNSSKIISPSVSLGRSLFATPTWRVCSKGNTPKFGPKVTHPLLIWASETFDRKLRPNGHRQRNGHNGEPIGNHHRSF